MNRFLPLWPRGGALILDRCRAFDLFASVDAHLCGVGYFQRSNKVWTNRQITCQNSIYSCPEYTGGSQGEAKIFQKNKNKLTRLHQPRNQLEKIVNTVCFSCFFGRGMCIRYKRGFDRMEQDCIFLSHIVTKGGDFCQVSATWESWNFTTFQVLLHFSLWMCYLREIFYLIEFPVLICRTHGLINDTDTKAFVGFS